MTASQEHTAKNCPHHRNVGHLRPQNRQWHRALHKRYHKPWSVFLEQHELGTRPPKWLSSGNWDGILSRPADPQHLRIKAFYGTSPNAVRTQIWTASPSICSSPFLRNVCT